MQRTRGFTLIELVVTLTVAGILTALAIPSFKTTIQNNRLVTSSNDLLSALLYARSQAISGVAATTTSAAARAWVCASSNGDTCSGTNWAKGWVVRGYNSSPSLPSSGAATNVAAAAVTLIRAYPALANGMTLNGTPYGSSITFANNGTISSTITGSTLYFILCDSRGATYGRAIYLGNSGEARVSTSAGKLLNGTSISGC